MSWMADFMPGAEERKAKELAAKANARRDPSQPELSVDGDPLVKDASGREVSTKTANQPFLKYQAYRKKQEEELEARKARNKERLEKMARGEPAEPLESEDLEAEKEISLWGLIKFLLFVAAGVMLTGHFITGDYLWDYQGRFRHLKTYWPTTQTLYSEGQLAMFDGTHERYGVYVAIDGDVYDVSSNRRSYGPGGSYAFMAGKDAARAFATGCFKEHQTHDIRGLDEGEQKSLEHWKNFFANHKDYAKVGRVNHPPIDPASPIPEHCDPEAKKKRAENRAKEKQAEASAAKAETKSKESKGSHKEL